VIEAIITSAVRQQTNGNDSAMLQNGYDSAMPQNGYVGAMPQNV
jgi:hypothetical protein